MSASDGDAGPYGGFVPAARSGLTGKRGMGGDIGNLVGDGGDGDDVPLGLSVSFANLTVLRWVCCSLQIL